MTAPPGAAQVYLVTGSDPILREQELHRLLSVVMGQDDPGLALEELVVPGAAAGADADGEGGDRPERAEVVGRALAAATTPPFGTGKRVVVLRGVGALTTADAGPLVDYLGQPMETTVLVLVGGGGATPPALVKACRAAGAEELGGGKDDAAAVLSSLARRAHLTLGPRASKRVVEHVGEDVGRLPSIVELLASTYGPGASLDETEVEPYLAESGAIPVYLLSKAIDAGDHVEALAVLERLRSSGGMHPLQVMGLLHRHFERLLRLDDPEITGEADAVAALGGTVKPYPAKLAWQQARALGSSALGRAFELLADADLGLRGASGAPPEAIVEVLVTKLAGLSRAATPARQRGRGR